MSSFMGAISRKMGGLGLTKVNSTQVPFRRKPRKEFLGAWSIIGNLIWSQVRRARRNDEEVTPLFMWEGGVAPHCSSAYSASVAPVLGWKDRFPSSFVLQTGLPSPCSEHRIIQNAAPLLP